MDFQDRNEDSWYNTSFETEYERSRAASENALRRSERKHRRIISNLLSLSIILSSFVYAIVKGKKSLCRSLKQRKFAERTGSPQNTGKPGEQFEDDFKDFFERFYRNRRVGFRASKDSVKRFKPEADFSLKTVPTPEAQSSAFRKFTKNV